MSDAMYYQFLYRCGLGERSRSIARLLGDATRDVLQHTHVTYNTSFCSFALGLLFRSEDRRVSIRD